MTDLSIKQYVIVRQRAGHIYEAYCLKCQRLLGAGGLRESKLECSYHIKNGCDND